MAVVTLVFAILSYFYKYVNHNEPFQMPENSDKKSLVDKESDKEPDPDISEHSKEDGSPGNYGSTEPQDSTTLWTFG